MEAIKGVIYDGGQVEYNGSKYNKYMVALIVVTNEEIPNVKKEQEIAVAGGSIMSMLTDELVAMKQYKVPHPGQRLGDALVDVSRISVDDLDLI